MLTGSDSELKIKPYITDFVCPFIWIFISHPLSVQISLDTGAVQPWGQRPVHRAGGHSQRPGSRAAGCASARTWRTRRPHPPFRAASQRSHVSRGREEQSRGAGAVAGVPGRGVLWQKKRLMGKSGS